MGSKYWEWKFRDVKPDEPPKPLSKKKKILNWLFYNKLWLIIGAVLLWILGSMLFNVLGIGQVQPDHIFAYVGQTQYSKDQIKSLETALSSLGSDVNGDGKIKVEVRQYSIRPVSNEETAVAYQYAIDTQLVADITAEDSYFFLTDSPEDLQKLYQILAYEDGTLTADDDYGADGKVFQWKHCPALCALTLDQTLFEDLYIGRRGFYQQPKADHSLDILLWEQLIKGNH